MDVPDLSSVNLNTQVHIMQGYMVVKIVGGLYSSIRSGGGLKRIFTAFWLGETVPKAIADDYKDELKTKMFKGTGDGTLPPKDPTE